MDDLISEKELREELPQFGPQYWAQKRHKGGGPRYRKVGRKVLYRRSEVEAWLDANTYERTDKPVTA